MNWLSRMWGGPFKTPPMQHPVSVGWVLLKVLETIWRLILIVLVFIAIVLGAAWVSQQNPLSSDIEVRLAKDLLNCPDASHPLHLVVRNTGSKKVGTVGLRFRVYEIGKSQDVASYSDSTPDLKEVIPAKSQIGYCFSVPAVEAGADGPFTVVASVEYASEAEDDVPISKDATPLQTGASADRPWWAKPLDAIGVIACIGLFASGGYGLIKLVDRTTGIGIQARIFGEGEQDKGGFAGVMLAAILNAILVIGGSYLLDAIGLGGWVESIDRWSRSSGLADGGLMLLTAVICQWPWSVLSLVGGEKEPVKTNEVD